MKDKIDVQTQVPRRNSESVENSNADQFRDTNSKFEPLKDYPDFKNKLVEIQHKQEQLRNEYGMRFV